MTLHQYFLITLAIAIFIALPIWGILALWQYSRLTPQEKRNRRDAQRGSTGAAMIGSAFGVLDKIIRPSVEFQAEAQEKIVKEDEQGRE
ncbi:MAG: hypothetical protein SH868_16875 [Bythopirellula sp.]|nr:hypothetical protein [Bythopirellula sp.]